MITGWFFSRNNEGKIYFFWPPILASFICRRRGHKWHVFCVAKTDMQMEWRHFCLRCGEAQQIDRPLYLERPL